MIMLTNLKQMQSHANYGKRAMETGDHSKNGASPKSLMSRNNFFIFAIVATLFCSHITWGQDTYHVDINAYGNKENLTDKKVALLTCNDERISKSDLKHLEIEGYLKKALRQKGYTFTSDNNEANIVIFYEYGISDPKEYTYQRIVPVWGQTGIAYSETTQRKDVFGRPVYSTTNTPSYGQVGGTAITKTTTKYMKWANISAYDADFYRQTGEDKMLWLTEINSEGPSDDLRTVFPYMMAAAKEYMEQSSGQKISVRIDSADDRWDEFNETLVRVKIKKPASKRELPSITVHQDVYRDGKLFIKAGTPIEYSTYRYTRRKQAVSEATAVAVTGESVALSTALWTYVVYPWSKYYDEGRWERMYIKDPPNY
jgi:hypothetical protein